MKFQKAIVPVSICAAVIFAAIAAIVVTNNRAAVARAKAAEAESREIEADKLAKAAKDNAAASASNLAAAKAAKEKEVAERDRIIAERETKGFEEQTAVASAATAKANAEAAQAKARAERDRKEVLQLVAETNRIELAKLREQLDKEIACSNKAAEAAANMLACEVRRTEAVIAEANLRESRKLRLEQKEWDLFEKEQELNRRERALLPDISIYDSTNITWVAEREADVIGVDSNKLFKSVHVPPEDDPRLSRATRELARTERLDYESRTNRLASAKAKKLATLEKLYADAYREGRVSDAKFYLKSIKSLNPDYQK